MKKLQLIILLISLLCILNMKAQYYEEPDTVIIENKNTLGLYVSPLATFMMNSFVHNPRIGIQYKRLLAPYKRLRLSLVNDVIKYSYADEETNPIDFIKGTNEAIIAESEARKEQKTTLRAGLEWSDYTKKVDALFGLDIIAGYNTDEYSLTESRYDFTPVVIEGDTGYFLNTAPTKIATPYSYFYEYIEVGLAPVIGWRFDIKNNWEFVVAASPEVSVAIPIASEWRGEQPMPIGSTPDTEIEFRLRLLEMVLSYRF